MVGIRRTTQTGSPHRRAPALLVLLILALAGSAVPVSAGEGMASDTSLLEHVAREHGIPLERLQIRDRVTLAYPLTKRVLEAAKVLDTATGKAFTVALDAHGNSVDPAAATAAEEDARVAAFGKIDPRLHAKMASLTAAESIPVAIWLNISDPTLAREPRARTLAEAEADLVGHLRDVEQYMDPRRRGVIGELARAGVRADVPRYAPAVFARLTPAQIEQVSRRPDVAAVYGPEQYTTFEDKAATTQRAYAVWMSGNLGAGTSSRPVVHEDDGVSDSNPYLKNATHSVVYWCPSPSSSCPFGKNIGTHASEVAGVVASTHPLVRGLAPSSQVILSANSQDLNNDSKNVAAFEWARGTQLGNPTNMSWGTICGGFQTFMSRYVDWAVKNLRATFAIASGNHPSGCSTSFDDEKVAAPGLAWSVITVGSEDDRNTGFWAGDLMSFFSDWRNPDFAPSMEKPEVTAVGQDIRTTDTVGVSSFGVSGTSFSAPQVAGQVVQMLARRPGQTNWPETNKAAVLASAVHEIEAGTSRDGVGAIVTKVSDETYRLNRFINGCGAGCGPLVASDFPVTYADAISLTAGQRARVAIAWDSRSGGGRGTDTLGADLDLRVRHPNNSTIVCSSLSLQNAWEMCEFTAPVTGRYDILVSRTSSEGSWPGTFLGVAWAVRSVPNFCTGALNVPATGGTFAISTANGPTFFDSFAGWPGGDSGRERVLKLVLGSTKDLRFAETAPANPKLDLHVLQFPNCDANPITPTVRGNGADAVVVNDAAPGTYYLVVDGANGAVGTTNVLVSLTGP